MAKKTRFMTQSSLIAALYVALTFVSAAMGIASGVVQVRLSEALTVLPAMTGAGVPGLFIGCLAANLLTGASLWDIVFGSLATLLGALGTRYLGRKCYVAPIFPILSNTLIIPFVLKIAYGMSEGYSFLFLTIFLGEFISCGIFGVMLYKALRKTKLFKQ